MSSWLFLENVGSVGILPTEDIVNFLDAMNIETGLDPKEVLAAAKAVSAMTGIEIASRAATIGTRSELLELGADLIRNVLGKRQPFFHSKNLTFCNE